VSDESSASLYEYDYAGDDGEEETGCGERVFEWLLLGACSPDLESYEESIPCQLSIILESHACD
jgi:hypothetical protein